MLELDWICESQRTITNVYDYSEAAGFLNPLRCKPVQLISEPESEWVYAQSESALCKAPPFSETAVVIILSAGISPNPALISACQKNQVALARTSHTADEITRYLRKALKRLLSLHGTFHGVFLGVMNIGILVRGQSGVGKSEMALDLVQRGHQLVADDAVILQRQSDRLIGSSPEALKGYLEIRGLGIIHVEKMFGPSAVVDSYPLDLMIRLVAATSDEMQNVDRLSPSLQQVQMLGVEVPELTMQVAPGRNLSVLIEAAVRSHRLRQAGIDTSIEFQQHHERLMQEQRDD